MKSHRVDGDPIGSEKPRGKSRHRRKSGRDPGALTPTEQHQKNNLMKQFCRLEGSLNSEAYRNAPCWDANGRLKP
jgi:hypothetical protein